MENKSAESLVIGNWIMDIENRKPKPGKLGLGKLAAES